MNRESLNDLGMEMALATRDLGRFSEARLYVGLGVCYVGFKILPQKVQQTVLP